jgi:chaperonin GroEL
MEASVIIDKINAPQSRLRLYFYKEEYGDMIEMGIVDPTKGHQERDPNAASVAGMVLTTESLVADEKEENPVPPAPAGGMGGMY